MASTYSAQPEDQEPEIHYNHDSIDHPEIAGRHETADFVPANVQRAATPLHSPLKEKIHRLARIVGLKLSLLSLLASILGQAAYSQTSPAGDEKSQAKARDLHKKLLKITENNRRKFPLMIFSMAVSLYPHLLSASYCVNEF